MTGFFTPARMLRIALYAIAFYFVAMTLGNSLLARAGDSIWWSVLPWVLLAGFWALVITRYRQKKRPFDTHR